MIPNMNKIRVSSSPELHPPPNHTQKFDDSSLQGIAANVKLLLKLIEDHKEACLKDQNDGRRMLRVAGMMTILENIKSRIQQCMSSCKKRESVLRRSNSDLHRSIQVVPRDKKSSTETTTTLDDRDKLKRDLDSSLAARKGLEAMCFSLGKEKKIMADELTKKAQELSEMEEFVNEIRAQNDALLARVRDSTSSNTGGSGDQIHAGTTAGGGGGSNWVLQERNKTLSEQLQRLLAGYKSAKRRLQEAEIETGSVNATMAEMAMEMKAGRLRIQGLREKMATERNQGEGEGEGEVEERPSFDIEEEISGLEQMFLRFETKLEVLCDLQPTKEHKNLNDESAEIIRNSNFNGARCQKFLHRKTEPGSSKRLEKKWMAIFVEFKQLKRELIASKKFKIVSKTNVERL